MSDRRDCGGVRHTNQEMNILKSARDAASSTQASFNLVIPGPSIPAGWRRGATRTRAGCVPGWSAGSRSSSGGRANLTGRQAGAPARRARERRNPSAAPSRRNGRCHARAGPRACACPALVSSGTDTARTIRDERSASGVRHESSHSCRSSCSESSDASGRIASAAARLDAVASRTPPHSLANGTALYLESANGRARGDSNPHSRLRSVRSAHDSRFESCRGPGAASTSCESRSPRRRPASIVGHGAHAPTDRRARRAKPRDGPSSFGAGEQDSDSESSIDSDRAFVPSAYNLERRQTTNRSRVTALLRLGEARPHRRARRHQNRRPVLSMNLAKNGCLE
jgi:hypothetical protein